MGTDFSREGGTTGPGTGNISRWLDPVTVFTLSTTASGGQTGELIAKIKLKGLSPNLIAEVGTSIIPPDGGDQPIYPVNPGTVAAYPIYKHTRTSDSFMRPLRLTPPPIPWQYIIGGGYTSGADDLIAAGGNEYELRVSLDSADYQASGIDGGLTVLVRVTYNGNWWDVEAIQRLLGAVTLEGVDPITIETGGE